MNNKIKFFRYKVAVGITFKKLREEMRADGIKVSQQNLNNDIFVKYGKTWNAGREESLPNTTLENLLFICDYYKITTEELFKSVNLISAKDIDDAIANKKKLSKLYNALH